MCGMTTQCLFCTKILSSAIIPGYLLPAGLQNPYSYLHFYYPSLFLCYCTCSIFKSIKHGQICTTKLHYYFFLPRRNPNYRAFETTNCNQRYENSYYCGSCLFLSAFSYMLWRYVMRSHRWIYCLMEYFYD